MRGIWDWRNRSRGVDVRSGLSAEYVVFGKESNATPADFNHYQGASISLDEGYPRRVGRTVVIGLVPVNLRGSFQILPSPKPSVEPPRKTRGRTCATRRFGSSATPEQIAA